MPLPWYITTITKVLSTPLLPIYPFILTLEAMRGAFLSGTSLALFIDIPSCPPASSGRELAHLRGFLDITKQILETIPEPLLPLAGPWIDYYHACECFLEIARQLSIGRIPATCAEFWEPPNASNPASTRPSH